MSRCRHFIAVLLALSSTVGATQIDFIGQPGSTHLTSTGQPWDALWTAEQGSFIPSFTPTASNTAQWAAAWRAASRTRTEERRVGKEC